MGQVEGHAVPGFLPSTHGFRFRNSFPRVPLRWIGAPGLVRIPIGDASNGLCGGMAYAARDYFEAGKPPPTESSPPAEGPLFDYIVRRLFDSFDLPYGPVRYLELMNPVVPDGETFWSRLGVGPHGRRWRLVRREWPRIRAEIDADRLCPLGLVRVRSADPRDLKENHQVLAYRYEASPGKVTVWVYDPNRPGHDDVQISFDPAVDGPARPISSPLEPIHGVFATSYLPASPP